MSILVTLFRSNNKMKPIQMKNFMYIFSFDLWEYDGFNDGHDVRVFLLENIEISHL